MRNQTLLFLLFLAFTSMAQDNVVIERYSFSDEFGTVFQVIIDKGNTKWMATDQGVFSFSDFSKSPNQIGSKIKATAITQNSRGDVWAAFQDGSIKNVKGEEQIKLAIEGTTVNQIKLIKSKIWVATDKGLFLYNTRTQKLSKSFNTDNSKLKSNKINFIHEDIYDIVWVGTAAGVVRFKNESFKRPLNSKENFRVITEQNDERWIVTDNDIHLVYEENRWNSMGLKDDLHSGQINDMVINGLGNVFFASDKLVKLDPYNGIIETYTDDLGLLSKKCLTLASDAYNHLYIGTGDAGLFRLRFADIELEEFSVACFLNKPINCHGDDDGELQVITTGGTPPYKYKWNKSSMRGKNPKGLKPGTYSVTVTDKNKIEAPYDLTFYEPDPIKIELVEAVGVSGPNKKDGSLSVVASGGKGEFKYNWDNGKNDEIINRLSAKEYTVTVSDANGCTAEKSFEVPREKFIPGLQIDKIEVGQTLRINNLYFEADSSIVTEISHEVLNEVYDFLNENGKVVIEIGGHTNNNPTHAYSDKLSSARAENVAIYLYEKGISKERISFKGYGKRKPIATNNSLSGRKKNQRVEIKILAIN